MNLKKILITSSLLLGGILSVNAEPMKTLPYNAADNSFCKQNGEYGYPSIDNDLYLCREAYAVAYNCDTKQPDYVFYKTDSRTLKSMKREDNFQADDSLPQQCQSQLSDYKKSGYDRGHMVPYADIDFNKLSADESFLLSNISPQKASLNRQGWAQLESYVRFWTKAKQELYIYTGPVYKNSKTHKTIGKNKVVVPEYYFKAIYAPNQNQVIAFIMPNAKVSKKDVAKYRVSLNDIKQRTGYDLFPGLTAEQKSTVGKMWETSYNK